MFSDGAVPFSDLTAVECLRAVAAGRRLDKPCRDMPQAVYELMRKCMVADDTRPTMAQVELQLQRASFETETETEL